MTGTEEMIDVSPNMTALVESLAPLDPEVQVVCLAMFVRFACRSEPDTINNVVDRIRELAHTMRDGGPGH